MSFLPKKENLKVTILFFLDREKYPESYQISQNLLDAYLTNKTLFIDKLQLYLENYPKSKFKLTDKCSNKITEEIIQKQDRWCRIHKLAGTPILIFNNKFLPLIYSIKDIDYMTL